jgi:hypothetical protein
MSVWPGRPGGGPLLDEYEPVLRRAARRAARHLRWSRSEGLARLIEEDRLDPRERVPLALRKWRWRREHGVTPGTAMPVWLVGVQRSGTNMLVRGLESSPEFEVHNESDRRAFRRFRLRPDHEVAALVLASRHRYVLLKPLCDSHRVAELLDGLGVPTPGRAIWAYRDVDGRARSALAKFGDANLRALREIASGAGLCRWQAQGLSARSLELLGSFDYGRMSPADAAALFWYVRNLLYFEQGLERRGDVMLCSYDRMVAAPEETMRALCAFLGVAWRPELVAHVAPRSGPGRPRLDLDPRIRAHCEDLRARLDQTAAAQIGRLRDR